MAKKVKVSEKPSAFYVGIANPMDVRRVMLEASKELLVSLKQYERLRQIRAKKIALYTRIHVDLATIKSQVLRIQKAFPRHDLSGLIAPKKKLVAEPTKVVAKVEAPKVVAQPKVMDEVTRLETELAEIEKKLSGM